MTGYWKKTFSQAVYQKAEFTSIASLWAGSNGGRRSISGTKNSKK
jgi:hypothetical protein